MALKKYLARKFLVKMALKKYSTRKFIVKMALKITQLVNF